MVGTAAVGERSGTSSAARAVGAPGVRAGARQFEPAPRRQLRVVLDEDREPASVRLRYATERSAPHGGRHGRPACPARRFEHHHEVFMRDERSPARGLRGKPSRSPTSPSGSDSLWRTPTSSAGPTASGRPADHADQPRRRRPPPAARFGHLEREWGTSDAALREARTTTSRSGRPAGRLGGGHGHGAGRPRDGGIAGNLGIRSDHRARHTRKPDEPPLTGTAAAVVRISPGGSRERARRSPRSGPASATSPT